MLNGFAFVIFELDFPETLPGVLVQTISFNPAPPTEKYSEVTLTSVLLPGFLTTTGFALITGFASLSAVIASTERSYNNQLLKSRAREIVQSQTLELKKAISQSFHDRKLKDKTIALLQVEIERLKQQNRKKSEKK
eukprot:g6882.t1